jgi:hypothetical protein
MGRGISAAPGLQLEHRNGFLGSAEPRGKEEFASRNEPQGTGNERDASSLEVHRRAVESMLDERVERRLQDDLLALAGGRMDAVSRSTCGNVSQVIEKRAFFPRHQQKGPLAFRSLWRSGKIG